MLYLILVALLVILITYIFVKNIRKPNKKIFFVGPHNTGKTTSILQLLGLSKSTVTTLSNHSIIYKGREITELVPDDETHDFLKKFSLNLDDTYIFFVKNEEEMNDFPDCTPFKVKFVMWKKVENKQRKDIIYLDETREKLIDLILKI